MIRVEVSSSFLCVSMIREGLPTEIRCRSISEVFNQEIEHLILDNIPFEEPSEFLEGLSISTIFQNAHDRIVAAEVARGVAHKKISWFSLTEMIEIKVLVANEKLGEKSRFNYFFDKHRVDRLKQRCDTLKVETVEENLCRLVFNFIEQKSESKERIEHVPGTILDR